MSATHTYRRLAGAGPIAALPAALLAAVLASGCATTTAPSAPEAIAETSPAPEHEAPPQMIPVVRYGRYTLVELAPTAAQRDLLLQTIDVSVPEDARATVGDGLRHVLQRSGYSLCETAPDAAALYALPLPAAHLHVGPMSLRDALLTLAGPAWELRADERTRQVCFERVTGSANPAAPPSAPPASEAGAAQTSPLAGDRP